MEMIIGGAYQGKTVYAKKEYPLLNWADGDKVTDESTGGYGFSEIYPQRTGKRERCIRTC